MFGTEVSPTSSIPSLQKAMDERIPKLLKKSKETTPSSDKTEKRKEDSPQEKNPYLKGKKNKKFMCHQ